MLLLGQQMAENHMHAACMGSFYQPDDLGWTAVGALLTPMTCSRRNS
jgi:hypothetical protein